MDQLPWRVDILLAQVGTVFCCIRSENVGICLSMGITFVVLL